MTARLRTHIDLDEVEDSPLSCGPHTRHAPVRMSPADEDRVTWTAPPGWYVGDGSTHKTPREAIADAGNLPGETNPMHELAADRALRALTAAGYRVVPVEHELEEFTPLELAEEDSPLSCGPQTRHALVAATRALLAVVEHEHLDRHEPDELNEPWASALAAVAPFRADTFGASDGPMPEGVTEVDPW